MQIDRDGRLVTTSVPAAEDARLRRAQALATGNQTGVEIARSLLTQKLAGQRRLLDRLTRDAETIEAFTAAEAGLAGAATINELVLAERDAALAYWKAWQPVEIRFRAADLAKLPEHWQRFGRRGSLLTSAPRLAINPINALLNYLYAILEAETRIACLALGLDPTLGIVHADFRARDSLALDLLEAIRPEIDAYLLDLLAEHTFKASDFHETNRGICRILAPLTHQLAETAPTWARQVAPVAEQVVATLAQTPGSRIPRVATPLTNTKRRARHTTRQNPATRPARAKAPKPAAVCRDCGTALAGRERVYCDHCRAERQQAQHESAVSRSEPATTERTKTAGHDRAHGGSAAKRRGTSNIQRKTEVRAWDERYGKLTDLSAFEREILPLIREIPLSRLQRASGLSLRYVSLIRRGERTPHPRHWNALLNATVCPK